jgi:phage terminase small subunit
MTQKARSARKQLTLKQRRFLKEYLRNGGNGVQAALAVYNTYSYSTANSIARANLQKPLIQEAIKRELEQYDVNPKALACTLADRLLIPPALRNS